MIKNNLILVLLVAFLAGLAGAYVKPWLSPELGSASVQTANKESAYHRVMRTGELRCGYAVFPPYFIKDPVTGALSGIWYDFTEALGEHLGLKIVWAEEVGLGDIGASLDANRTDAFCDGLWTAGKRVRVVDYLNPSAYEAVLAYVRVDDHRFDDDITKINDPNISISTIDGEGGALTASEEFPNAKTASLPQLSNYADMFNQVVAHKADVTLAAPSGAAVFLKNNPGTLRPIANHPLRIMGAGLAVKYGETELHDMLNRAQDDLLNNGVMNKILAKYEVNPGDYWRVAIPYQPPKD